MTQTIEALWNGELAFSEHCGAHDQQANQLVRELGKAGTASWSKCPSPSGSCWRMSPWPST